MNKTTHPNALAAKVAAVNRASAEANRLAPLIVQALAPYVGQKVLKADGTFLQKVKEALPFRPTFATTGNRLNVYLDLGRRYSVRLEVQASENHKCIRGDTGYQTGKVSLYLFELSNGVLGKAYNFGPLRTDYTESEVSTTRKNLSEAKSKVSDLLSRLYYFGEYEVNA